MYYRVSPTKTDERRNVAHFRKSRKKRGKRNSLTNRKRRRSVTGRKPIRHTTSSSSSSNTPLSNNQTTTNHTFSVTTNNQSKNKTNRTDVTFPPVTIVSPTKIPTRNITSLSNNLAPSHRTPSDDNQLNLRPIKSFHDQMRLRSTISFVYEFNYHANYVAGKIPLEGTKGVFYFINKSLMLKSNYYKTIKKVVLDTQHAIDNDCLYEPERVVYTKKHTHKLQHSSLDFHLISKMKQNSSFRTTAGVYNALIRGPLGLPPIGYTAIYNSIKRSNHVVVPTEVIYQASDSNKIWVRARFESCSQLLVRFGCDYPEDTCGMKISNEKYICKYEIIKNKLTLTIYQIAWWDEKHIKQVVGDFRDSSYQFGYDEDGNYCEEIEIELRRRVSK
jgi:hypothetical protein